MSAVPRPVVANSAVVIYRRPCRTCGDPFDALVTHLVRCVPCREGRIAPAAEKLAHIEPLPPSFAKDRARMKFNELRPKGRAVADFSRGLHVRTRAMDPRVAEVIDRAIRELGSKREVERQIGLADKQLLTYVRGRGVPIAVLDHLLLLIGETHRLGEFFD